MERTSFILTIVVMSSSILVVMEFSVFNKVASGLQRIMNEFKFSPSGNGLIHFDGNEISQYQWNGFDLF